MTTEPTIESLQLEIARLKTRVTVTEWSQPGTSKLILVGDRESTLELARENFDTDPSEVETLTGKERYMTNAEVETLPEFEP